MGTKSATCQPQTVVGFVLLRRVHSIMRNRKICVVTSLYHPLKYSSDTSNTIRLLQGSGWQVTVLSLAAFHPDGVGEEDVLKALKVNYIAYRGPTANWREKRSKLFKALAYAWTVWHLLKLRPHISIAFEPEALVSVGVASLVSKTHYVYYSLEILDAPRTRFGRLKKRLEKHFHRRASITVINNRRRLDVIKRVNNLADDHRFVVIPTSNIPVGPEELNSAKGKGFQPFFLKHKQAGKHVVIYHGNAAIGSLVVDLARMAVKWPPDLHLAMHVYGPPHLLTELRDIASEAADKVSLLTGWLPETELLLTLRDADVGVALYEPVDINHIEMNSGKIYKYLEAGLPVITVDFPALKEVVEENDAGVCVANASDAEITCALAAVLADPQSAANFSRNAEHAYLTKYRFDRCFAELIKLLDRMISGEDRSSPVGAHD